MKQFEAFRLDASNQCLWREGVQISLPPKPFAVLCYLVEHPGRLISHDELLDALWPETYVQPQVLRTYMLDLRKALGDDAAHPRFIQTLPKRGYRFVAAVTECASGGPSASSKPGKPDTRAAAFVGREDELARLHGYVAAVSDGQRRMVFLCGEAGIGKTALVDAFCHGLDAHAAIVARGQCVQGVGGREDYYPVLEALSQLCVAPGSEAACGILGRIAPAWLAAARRAGSDSAAARAGSEERSLGDLCAALEEISLERPLVLILEDVEWADECTLHLVSALARRRAAASLLVLATCRPMKGSSEHPLKALKQDLLMRRLCAEIGLGPLGKSAVRALVSRELGEAGAPPGLEGFVYQRAEGNPLFVIAILEHLIAERVLVRESVGGAAVWKQCGSLTELEPAVPGELAQMIEMEIDRLSAEEQSLLEAASLMNVAFPSWAVAAALGKELAETEEACDQLARRLHYVERAGQDELPGGARSAFYVFAHGLYREVMVQRQPSARRARRHVHIAARLRELFAGREADVAREVAMHYEAGGERQRAAETLREAAWRALERHAHGDAAELLEHALRLAEELDAQSVEAKQIRVELESARAAFQSREEDAAKSLTIS